MKIWVRRVVVAGPLGLALWGGSHPAFASGFASAHFGGEHGNVTETNPMSLYYNPGAIGFSEGTDLYGDAELAIRHATWDHPAQPVNPTDAPLPAGNDYGNTGTARLLNVFGGPAAGATTKFGNLAIGAGLFVPFGGRANWSKNPDANNPMFPLAADGVQRWHVIDAALTFIYTTAGAAYRLGPLSIGATGNLIISSVSTSQAHTTTNVIDSTSEGRADLNASGILGSFGVGAMLEAVPDRLWLGFSYQAQPGLGPETLKGTLDYTETGGTTKYNVDFHQSLPDIYRAGIRFRASDAVELRLFGDLTRWSVMKQQCVNIQGPGVDCVVFANGADASPPPGYVQANLVRDWNNTYGIRLGASYWVKPELEFFAGTGFETAASPDTTMEPATMDADNVLLALGARIKVTKVLYLQGSYTQLLFFNRDVTDSTLSEINGKDVRFPTQTQDGNGTYSQWIGVLQGSIEAKF